jgi:hypothetical protein
MDKIVLDLRDKSIEGEFYRKLLILYFFYNILIYFHDKLSAVDLRLTKTINLSSGSILYSI